MNTPLLKVKYLSGPHTRLCEPATANSVGYDVCSSEVFTIMPGEWRVIGTGFAIEPAPGFEVQIRPRSGFAAKFGITVLNSPGTIDPDYRGEVKIILINHGKHMYRGAEGDRIAQLVVAPIARGSVEVVEELSETRRGESGLGSTGR